MATKASVFVQNAAILRELDARVRSTAKDPAAHEEACTEFHGRYDQLAFPGGLNRGMARLESCDAETVALAVDFLDADPRFFRSGYIKETILRRLKHAPLTNHQKLVLCRLVVRSVDGGGRREFHGYARLAGALALDEVTPAMNTRLSSRHPEVQRRAAEVLHVLRSRRRGAK